MLRMGSVVTGKASWCLKWLFKGKCGFWGVLDPSFLLSKKLKYGEVTKELRWQLA